MPICGAKGRVIMGMKPRAAEALTATYSAMAVAEHFGVNVGESFAVGPLYGMGED